MVILESFSRGDTSGYSDPPRYNTCEFFRHDYDRCPIFCGYGILCAPRSGGFIIKAGNAACAVCGIKGSSGDILKLSRGLRLEGGRFWRHSKFLKTQTDYAWVGPTMMKRRLQEKDTGSS